MIIAEPGTPKGSRMVYGFRSWILDNYTRNEANIIAPCPHEGECPMAKKSDSWCHFSQFTEVYPKDVFPKHPKERPTSNEKYSFLAVCRSPTPR
jgi:ribosomal protein RSM22 (predicted rRNA methylase)